MAAATGSGPSSSWQRQRVGPPAGGGSAPALGPADEADLIERCKNLDRAAHDELYHRFRRQVAGNLYRVLGDRDATDAAVERATELLEKSGVRERVEARLRALTETARRTIAEHETLQLSNNDRKAFFEALVNPPAPSERLKRALAEHRRRVAS